MYNPPPKSTPMVNVWLVVFYTVIATALASLTWHVVGMNKSRIANETESKVVRDDLVRLNTYRDQLTMKIASTTNATSSATTTNKTPK